MILLLLDILKWVGAAILAILLIIAIATGLNCIMENSYFQQTADIIIEKFGPGGYYWKGN